MKLSRFKSAILFVLAGSFTTASASTTVAARLFTFGSSGTGNGQFNFPQSIALNRSAGLIYVADSNNQRIQILTSTGAYFGQFGSPGSGNSQFNDPTAVAIDQITGEVYVADYGNNRVEHFTALGAYLNEWGGAGVGNGQFQGPSGLAIQPSTGNVYVSESVGARIQYFNPLGVYLGKWGSSALFDSPDALAIDPQTDDVFVTNYNGAKVQRFTSKGILVALWTTKGGIAFNQPAGVAVDDLGRMIVTDRTTPVPVFNPDGTVLFQFANPSTNTNPYAVTAGANGLLYLSDGDSNSISAWQISTINLPPTISISGKSRLRTTHPTITLHGAAADPDGSVTTVAVKAGKAGARTASGTTQWTCKVRLKIGKNQILVAATDSDGGVSPPSKVTIQRLKSPSLLK